MGIWLIVPVKAMSQGKSRLSTLMPVDVRIKLNCRFLQNLLEKAINVTEFERILVISSDETVLRIAGQYGVGALQEDGVPDLNRALEQGRLLAMENGASAVLVLPIDLPFLQNEDIHRLLTYRCESNVVVIAPDRYGSGTNALLISPPDLIPFCFGEDSFIRHRKEALKVGARLEIYESASIAYDVDWPDDFLPLLNDPAWV